MRLNVLKISLILLLSLISAKAQTQQLLEADDIQSWNDVQLTVPMSKQFDFYTALTMRFGKNISRFNDGRYAIGFVYKPDKNWSVQPFYWFIQARNSRGQFRTESRLNLRIGYKFPTKSFSLSHRSWFEYRMRNTGNTLRYRPSLTFERDLPKKFNSKFYITEEVFYDSAVDKFSRNRFTVGINKYVTKQLSVDIYFMRQNDGNSRPGDISVLGTSWKIKL